jgi:para-nitrobenzyl esterase
MSDYWTNFAKSGDPNGPQLPPWPAFTDTDNKVLYLGDPIRVGGVPNTDGLNALDAVYAAVRGKALVSK